MSPSKKFLPPVFAFLAGVWTASTPARAAIPAGSVTQYGITWTFDKPYPAGQFVTGDWWVLGPVTVVSVSPGPGPGPDTEPATTAKSRFGATSLVDDKRCRNGSMIVLGPEADGTFAHQGYDSRATNYDPALSVAYPRVLPVNQSLVSTISSEVYKEGKLATPNMPTTLFPQAKGFSAPEAAIALETAAVLTCLDKEPPADAFRPPYAGTDKTIYRAGNIRWDLLPALKPAGEVPSWEKMARVYQRPWLDHVDDWTVQFCAPAQNQAAYGGLVAYMNSYASLMLLLDAPREQKRALMIGFLQYGIDLHGVSQIGRRWFSDGGHWIGRKWPIVFASIMLDQPGLRLARIDPKCPLLYNHDILRTEPGDPALPAGVFSEDVDSYYGKGADGQDVLWQIGFHSHARQTFMEKPSGEWNEEDKFCSTYLWTPGAWPAFALSALYLKARPTWNHDAFFDLCDWWMQPGQKKYQGTDKHAGPTRNNTDGFVKAMWDAHRAGAPEQPRGTENLKWVWTNGKTSGDGQHFSASKGHFVLNPPGR